MKLRDKDLLAIGPLIMILTILAVGLVVFYQAHTLPQQMRDKIKEDYLEAKKVDLRGYIKMAKRAIMHLYGPGSVLTNDEAKEEAKKILTNLRYSEEDGYFFGYSLEGTTVFHPVKKDWVGKNKWDYQDENGKFVIRDLIKAAREGNGFVEYIFKKPSVIEDEGRPKLAYVVMLPELNFVLGTGVYRDDIDSFLNGVDVAVSGYIRTSMIWIALITCLGLLVLSFVQRRIGRIIEQKEIGDDLHDKALQEMIFIIKEIEIKNPSTNLELLAKIESSAQKALGWTRDIIDGKDPSNLSLIEGLNKVIEEKGLFVHFSTPEENEFRLNNLSKIKKTALTKTAREALNNILKHAQIASQVDMKLEVNACNIILSIQDDGAGFNPDKIKRRSGLNIMKQRIKAVGGKFHITSSPVGTIITAIVPLNHNIWNYLLCLINRQ